MRHFIKAMFTILIFTIILPNSVFAQSAQKVIDYGNMIVNINIVNIALIKCFIFLFLVVC